LWSELAALSPNPKPDSPVVPDRSGGQLNRQIVHRAVKRAARRAGLATNVSPHWLRHSHASHALDHGAPPHVVQASLGHASLATTTAYAHIRRGDASSRYLPEVGAVKVSK
jgi:integrase/recombinase XerD